MTLACPFPGCRTLVIITADAEPQTSCSEHRDLEVSEAEEQFLERVRTEMNWRKPWVR